MVDAETQDFAVGTSSYEDHTNVKKASRKGVEKRQSMLMSNITKEARQSHKLLCYPRKWASALASFQVILGMLSIIFMSVHIYDCHSGCKAIFWTIGYGIWSGVLFIFTGIFGIWTSHNSYRGTIIFYSLMCVLTACECSLPFSFAVCDSVYSLYNQSDPKKLWRIMIALVAAICVLEAVVAMVSAILCCRTVCRETKNKKAKKKVGLNKSTKSSGIDNNSYNNNGNNYDDNNILTTDNF